MPNLLPEATKTDVGLFMDFGNVWGVDYDDSIDDSSKLRSSTGVAANWVSPIGPMSFIISTNISKASRKKVQTLGYTSRFERRFRNRRTCV